MAAAVNKVIGNLFFHHRPPEHTEWLALLDTLVVFALTDSPDVTSWMLEPSDKFSTKSLYNRLAAGRGLAELSELWKVRLPPHIRIFLWQLIRGRLPSGDQVLKRSGPGDWRCPLCEVEEDMYHIFFTCASAQFLWSYLREVWVNWWRPANFPGV